LGTGGALQYDVTHFELLDHQTSQTVHQTFAPTAYYWGYLAAASSCNKDTASSTMRSPVPGSQ
jgi:hypothetical protein